MEGFFQTIDLPPVTSFRLGAGLRHGPLTFCRSHGLGNAIGLYHGWYVPTAVPVKVKARLEILACFPSTSAGASLTLIPKQWNLRFVHVSSTSGFAGRRLRTKVTRVSSPQSSEGHCTHVFRAARMMKENKEKETKTEKKYK